MDIEGDWKRGSKSIAIRLGKNAALRILSFFFAFVILVSFVPYIFCWLGIGYLVIIFLMDLAIIIFTIRPLKSQRSEEGRFYIRRIYLVALFGLLAFWLGRFLA